jgi:hypothetical protein
MKKKARPAAESASLHPNRIEHPHGGDLTVHEAAKVASARASSAVVRGVVPALIPESAGEGELQPATLVCQAPGAREVFVAGDFNGWQPRATPMVRHPDGRWTVTLPLRPGPHEYRFVIDGRWEEDAQSARSVPNPFGGSNSILEVWPNGRPQA